MLKKAEGWVHLCGEVVAAQALEILPRLKKKSCIAGPSSLVGKEFGSAPESFVSIQFRHEHRKCYMRAGKSIYNGSELTITRGA